MAESRIKRWHVWIASVILPPAGAVMMWLCPWSENPLRRTLEIAGRVLATGALVILTLVYMVRLGIIHVEMSGAGWKPIFSLHDPESDQKALERHRSQMNSGERGELSPMPQPAAVSPGKTLVESGKPTEAAGKPSEPSAVPDASPSIPPPAWAEFRGQHRDGIYREGGIRTHWPDSGLPPLWRQPIGGGYASFAIAQGLAFTIEQRRDREVVAAYDIRSGKEFWIYGWPALFSESMGGDGPRATPTWKDGKLYALGATGEFHVLDALTGRLLWKKNILSENGAQNITWGMANSPLIVDHRVVVTPGGPGGRSIVAYHKDTGEFLWGALDDRAAYTSPMLATLGGRRQILAVTASRIVGIDPQHGTLLWEFPWTTMSDINSTQPIVTGDARLWVSAGYGHGSVLLEISQAASGMQATSVWENRNLKSRFNAGVLHEGYIYGFDEGIFACIDAASGERKWKGGRYGYGQTLLAGEHVLVLTESGELVLLKASPESHQEVARSAAIEGKTWNNPAMADGILLVRNAREMAAFRLAP